MPSPTAVDCREPHKRQPQSDPVITAGAILVMLFACVCAGLVPAVGASLIDPVKALRQE